jgi:hypothetical protein
MELAFFDNSSLSTSPRAFSLSSMSSVLGSAKGFSSSFYAWKLLRRGGWVCFCLRSMAYVMGLMSWRQRLMSASDISMVASSF